MIESVARLLALFISFDQRQSKTRLTWPRIRSAFGCMNEKIWRYNSAESERKRGSAFSELSNVDLDNVMVVRLEGRYK